MELVSKLKVLAEERNLSFSALERELGFGNGTIKKWDTSSPSCDKLLRLANFLNVSIDSLLRDADTTPASSGEPYEHLVSLYKSVSDEDKLRVINYLELANSLPLSTHVTNYNTENQTHKPILLKSIPIRGYVAAGIPIEANENNLGSVDVPSNLDVDYALIVSGNSMNPIIKDGEYVYVKFTNELNINDIGVFYYNGNVTCKKFFKNDVMVKLISINPTYEDFVFYLDDAKNETINFTIEGQVILSENQQKRLSQYYQMTH